MDDDVELLDVDENVIQKDMVLSALGKNKVK